MSDASERRFDLIRYLKPRLGLEHEFDLLFVDTEFTRLPMPKEAAWEWADRCHVLSIGIVPLDAASEQDGCFYITRTINRVVLAQCVPFVVESVIPRFGDAKATGKFSDDGELTAFIDAYLKARRNKTGKAALLAVDWLGDAYLVDAHAGNHEWLLLEGMKDIEQAMSANWPAERSRHNALHDALTVRDGYQRFVAAAT